MENINNINDRQQLQSAYEKYFGKDNVNMKYWGARQVRMYTVEQGESGVTPYTLKQGVTPYDVYKALPKDTESKSGTEPSFVMMTFAPYFDERDKEKNEVKPAGPMKKYRVYFENSVELQNFVNEYTREVTTEQDMADWNSIGTLGLLYNDAE